MLISGLILLSGCTSEKEETTTTTLATTTTTTTTTSTTTTTLPKTLSDLALKPSDLRGDYNVEGRGPVLRSEVAELYLNLAWKEGYFVSLSESKDSGDITAIVQGISRYPLSTISDVLDASANELESMEDATVEELPSLDMGVTNKAYRVTIEEVADSGESVLVQTYVVMFIKDDIFETIMVVGTSPDYELFKEVAKLAEGRI